MKAAGGGPPPPLKAAGLALPGQILLGKHAPPMKAAGVALPGQLPGAIVAKGGGVLPVLPVQCVGPQYRHFTYAQGAFLATYGLAPPPVNSEASLARGGPYNRLPASHKILLAGQAAINRAAQVHLHVSPPLDGQLAALGRRRTTGADLERIAQAARDNHLSACMAQLCHSGGQWLEHSDSVAHLEGIQTTDGLRVVHRISRYGNLPAMSRVWVTDVLLDLIAADSDTFVGLAAPEEVPVATSDEEEE
jgi:hypothetical protein